MHMTLDRSPMFNKYLLLSSYVIVATAILSVTLFVQAQTLFVPSNDFMLIAWQPGEQLLQHGAVDANYPYPLWTLILMLPFVLWAPAIGAQLWLVCNLILLAISIVILVQLFDWPYRLPTIAIASLLIGIYAPIFTSLWLGQIIFVSLLSMVMLIRALQSGSWTTVGVILGLCLIKPHVTILLTAAIFGLAIWQLRWKVFVGFGIVLCLFLAFAVPFAVTPWQVFGAGAGEHLILYLAHTSTIWGLSLTLIPDSLLFPAILSCLLCGWVLYLWIQALRQGRWKERALYLVAITVTVNLLVLPYSWSYNQALLILPFCYAIDRTRQLRWSARIAWLATLIALIYPFSASIYMMLTVVYQSDVYQVIPVLCFLPLLGMLQKLEAGASTQIFSDSQSSS